MFQIKNQRLQNIMNSNVICECTEIMSYVIQNSKQFQQILKLMNQQKQRVLIIGAGPSGLSLLRAFECQYQKWHPQIELVCVQKQKEWGGQWNYIVKDKIDKNGLPIPSTNEYLWTNAPKECFQYPDYSFEEHFNGQPMPSYLPRHYLRQYFIHRFSSYNISKYIRYNTICNNIRYSNQDKKFTVEIQNLIEKKITTETFAYVIVASGHYSMPNIPHVDGLKDFDGKLLHSVQVKDYLDYKNQRVLVIGSGLSAQDAILQCYKYGASSVTVSYRTKPMSQKLPSNIEQLPLLTKVIGNTVEFKNGETRDFDTIIMCTGYVHNFTFLQQSLRLRNTTKLWTDQLYLGVVFIRNPQLMYVGTQAQYFSFMMFDIQSRLVKNIILGYTKLPSAQQMRLDTAERSQRLQRVQSPYESINFMGEYLKQLIDYSSYPGYNIDRVIKLYYELQQHKQQNILTFRDNIYQSAVSGKWSIMKKQSWLEMGTRFEEEDENEQKENEKISVTDIHDQQRTEEMQIF